MKIPVMEIAVLAGVALVGYWIYSKITGITNPITEAAGAVAGVAGAAHNVATLPGAAGAAMGKNLADIVYQSTPTGKAVAVGAAKTAIKLGMPSLAMPWSLGAGMLGNLAQFSGVVYAKQPTQASTFNPMLAHKAAVASGLVKPVGNPMATGSGFNFLVPPKRKMT